MSWKFWQRKPRIEFELESEVIPTSTLFRWFLYDIGVDNPNKFIEAAGFNPISEEAEEMELKDSSIRLTEVLPYKAFIAAMAAINGEIMAETLTNILLRNGVIHDEVSAEEEKATLMEVYEQVSLSALVPAFAAALHMGIVINPGTLVTEGEYEF